MAKIQRGAEARKVERSEAEAAQARIQAWITKNAKRRTDIEREEAEGIALERWLMDGTANPETYARWALLDVVRKAARRGTVADSELIEAAQNAGAVTVEDLFTTEPEPEESAPIRATERRYDTSDSGELRALQRAVRKRCIAQLPELGIDERRLGWVRKLVREKDALGKQERAAREIFGRLRQAMIDANALATSPVDGFHDAECLGLLRWWVPEYIAPLLEHAAVAADPEGEVMRQEYRTESSELVKREWFLPRWTPIETVAIDRFIRDLQTKDLLGVGHRKLSALELARVWLAGGAFPNVKKRAGWIVGQVIDKQRQAFDAALERVRE